MARLFALDQNFPVPIVALMADYIPEARLVKLGDIDPRLTSSMDDWEVILALHHHAEPWGGLVTTDSGILNLPRELAVIMQTKLTLVVAEASGHDPVKATGLLLAYLPAICSQTKPDVAQIWRLATRNRQHQDPWEHFSRVAAHRNEEASKLYHAEKLSASELALNPLASRDDAT